MLILCWLVQRLKFTYSLILETVKRLKKNPENKQKHVKIKQKLPE